MAVLSIVVKLCCLVNIGYIPAWMLPEIIRRHSKTNRAPRGGSATGAGGAAGAKGRRATLWLQSGASARPRTLKRREGVE